MANSDLCDGHRVLVITALNILLTSPEPTTHPHCIPSMRKAEAPGGVMTYLRLLPDCLLREPHLAPSTHEAKGSVFTHLEVISIWILGHPRTDGQTVRCSGKETPGGQRRNQGTLGTGGK